MARRARPPRTDPAVEWIAGRRHTPFVIEEPRPAQPDALMLMDRETGLILGAEIVPAETSVAEAAEIIARMVRRPTRQGLPASAVRRPQAIRVEDAALAAALQPLLAKGVEVRPGPAPELDHVMRSMAAAMGTPRDQVGYLEGKRIEPAVVERFFAAAARLYARQPWGIVQDDCQLIRVDSPDLDVDAWWLSIIGALGQNFGLVVFQSLADFESLPPDPEATTIDSGSLPVFSVNFDRLRDLPKAMQRDVARHHWPVSGPRAYPWILAMVSGAQARPLVERDYHLAIAMTEALCVFLERHRSVFEHVPDAALSLEVTIEDLPGRPRVRLTAPHPDARHLWEGDAELEGGDVEAGRILDGFAAAQVARSHSQDWLAGASAAVGSLLHFKTGVLGEPALGWTPAQVEEYLLRHLPSEAFLTADIVAQYPDWLDAFFQWLGEVGLESPAAAGKLRARVARCRPRFLAAMSDPRLDGPAKALLREMERAGVDLGDPGALQSYLDRRNTCVAREAGLRDTQLGLFDASAQPSDRSGRLGHRRWVPEPGLPLPLPADPCPCNSGRRYRKCCMPR
jgi:hypothetical protein